MKILVVDDHPLVRASVVGVLLGMTERLEALEAGDGTEALDCLAHHADVSAVLLDLRMAGMDGLALLEQLARLHPDLPALVMSSSEDPKDVHQVLRAGARGYCPKSAQAGTLVQALRLVLSGKVYLPPFMATAGAAVPQEADASSLTPRQREVLQAMCLGQSNQQIAVAMGMEEATVKGHVSAIFRALNVVHRLQAVEVARAAGLVAAVAPG